MELVIALFASVLFVLIFRKAIAALPVIFYLIALIIDVVFLANILFEVNQLVARTLYPYLQRSLFAFGLFTIVMFVGVLPEGSKVRKYLLPIRGELSIIAAILAFGHVINYVESYLGQILSGMFGMQQALMWSFIVAAILAVLLTILTVTSFNAVRKRMKRSVWKQLQKLAYLFYGLVFVHLLLILFPPALLGSSRAIISLVVYTLLMVLYATLRVRKHFVEKSAEKAKQEMVSAERQAGNSEHQTSPTT